MQSKLLQDNNGQKTFVLILDSGDEVMKCLTDFARTQHLAAAHFSAIGAFERAVIGYFDWRQKDYQRIPVSEQVEVVSLLGDVAQAEKGPMIHAHVVLGRPDGSALAGHLLEGIVRPTLEVILTESPAHLQRKHDAESGLALIRL